METELYAPVKAFLEALGFTVKGEVGGCDIVGLQGDCSEVVVICELKLSFNLELVLQAVDRASLSDEVWIAAMLSKRGKGREGDKRFRDLCRRLGIGMLGITALGEVEILVSASSAMPRRNAKRRSRLIEEHKRRRGDPMPGGGSRVPVITAYRQEALTCAAGLRDGPRRPRDLRSVTPNAAKILLHNVYGWFVRVERGVYGLSDKGREAVRSWSEDGLGSGQGSVADPAPPIG